jgi:hypothetical protein
MESDFHDGKILGDDGINKFNAYFENATCNLEVVANVGLKVIYLK